MISFALDDEQMIARSTFEDFSRTVAAPAARAADDAGVLDGAMLGAFWELGFVQLQSDPLGCPQVTNAVLLEALAVGDASLAFRAAVMTGFISALNRFGTPSQRELALPELCGSKVAHAALAIRENGFVSDLHHPATKATCVTNGFVLRGRKAMIACAAEAKWFLVFADHDQKPALFLVPGDAPGLEIVRPEGTLGMRSVSLSDIVLHDVNVSADLKLGIGGAPDVQAILDASHVAIAAILAGLSRAVLDYVVPYTKSRIVHGAPLALKQSTAFTLADMHADIEAMRWMTWRAAWELESGRSATRSAQLALGYAGRQAVRIADDGIQALGGHGYVTDHPVEMWYRNACSLRVLEGCLGL